MTTKSPRKSNFPGSLTDLHRFRPTTHGHDGSSRIVMVRKTDQRTYAIQKGGNEPMLETVTRETIETFRGQRTACKITTEKKNREEKVPPDLLDTLAEKADRSRRGTPVKTSKSVNAKKSLEQFQQECLQEHNKYRQNHGVHPLKLNKHMCKSSLDHATFLSKKKDLHYSNIAISNKKYGENIYLLTSPTLNANTDIKGSEPVDLWYREVKKHDFTKEPTHLATGYFTQVVWKETKELGVAFVATKGKLVVVAQYYPPGNIIGTFVENVPPLVNLNNNSISTLSTLNISKAVKNLFNKEVLEAHNKYRLLHGAKPLELDANLCRFSEEWAKMCGERSLMEHRKNNPYGENIFFIHNVDPNFVISGNVPVDTWYKEHEAHHFGKEPSSLSTGHFSQVVWKTSEKLGVGVAIRNGDIYVVANYSPAGNFVGHFAENVLPIGSLLSPEEIRVSFENRDFDAFQEDALRFHNDYRRRHGVPPLTLNKDLCFFALEWAHHCAFHGMSHRSKNQYGENIYMVYSSDFAFTPSAKDAVATWYAQKRHHIFGLECVNMNTLHFTQLVWKETAEVGIALAKNSKGETFVVANYSPRGNVVGQFNANVLKARV